MKSLEQVAGGMEKYKLLFILTVYVRLGSFSSTVNQFS